jgi:hypothetical protein
MGRDYDQFSLWKPSDWRGFLYREVGLPTSLNLRVKDHCIFAARILRRKPSTLVNGFNKAMLEVWVDPIRPLVEKYCSMIGYRRGWDVNLVRALWERLDEVSQALEDNQESLVPFILQDHDLKQLKDSLSKKGWKKLCNNSISRNQRLAIADTCEVGEYINIPTTLLRQIFNKNHPMMKPDMESIDWFLNNYKGHTTLDQRSERLRMMTIYKDTQRMSVQLGEDFNPKWSYRRISEKHEEFTRAIHRRHYSDDVFPWTTLLPEEVKKVEHEDYTATLLDNALAIREEGDSMGHCVGSYAVRSSNADYMVYSITKGDERVSTLGINVDNHISKEEHKPRALRGGYRFNQHYGKYNSYVTDEDVKTLESKVLMKLKSMSEGFEDE